MRDAHIRSSCPNTLLQAYTIRPQAFLVNNRNIPCTVTSHFYYLNYPAKIFFVPFSF